MICLSIGQASVEECIDIIKDTELAEIRLDLNIYTDDELELIFSSHKNLIATCREGKYTSDERKLLVAKAIKSGAKYIDLELTNDYTMNGFLANTAKMSECKVIISYHNYENCPNIKNLHEIVNRCFDNHADIAKVVCKVNSFKDNSNIMSLYEKDRSIIALGMGNLGKITRVAAPFLGAPFTYAYPQGRKRTAEGQFSELKIKEIINLIS
ncbi:MAG: type I 3-dehydroquinate dehydratase [Candidatus Delongbacteria bacterium]|jgi:3-dehydroquinate dehydratase-1|nr:type I 3-dehydroquinate dehydratase [Candidatus Delongbacteria bacterium]